MKATELRIGNWVQTKQTEKQFQVTTSTFEVLSVVESQYKPIPLTEEWLERFGFDDFGYGLYEIKQVRILKAGDVWFLSTGYIEPIVKYVHQLQNLYFSLTGQELQTDETKKKVKE